MKKKAVGLGHAILLIMLILAPFSNADPSTLPENSVRLIKRLHEYESNEQAKADQSIDKKRAEVLMILRKHMATSMKSGKLDQSVALRKEIEKLEALLAKDLPTMLVVSNEKYFYGIRSKRFDRPPSEFVIDGDHNQGKMELEFKHEHMQKMFNYYNHVELHLSISNKEFSESGSVISVSHKNKILGQKRGAKKGEVVQIPLETWKVARFDGKLLLLVECLGNDGVAVVTQGQKNSSVLVFSRSKAK